jgi:trans-2,3-dihydro-3-hydroxyanthranilate isomerase
MQVDAFARRRLEGNPCAVVFDADGLDDATMLAIAREMNLAETSFVLSPRQSDFRARYFTLDGEIPLAGHPTVATVHALVESGQLNMGDGHRTISLEIGAGVIDVNVAIEDTTRVTMTQMKPRFLETVAPEIVLGMLGLEADDLIPDVPLQVVSTGTPQLMVPAIGLDAMRRARPDLEALSHLKRETEATCVPAGDHRRPVHRLGDRRHGGLSLALRPDRRAPIHRPAGPLDQSAGQCLRRGGRPPR